MIKIILKHQRTFLTEVEIRCGGYAQKVIAMIQLLITEQVRMAILFVQEERLLTSTFESNIAFLTQQTKFGL